MKSNQDNIVRIIMVLWSVIFSSCNESLPLREDVSDLVTISIRSLYYTTSRSNLPGKIRTLVTVTNNTDETLDDISPMSGTLEIRWSPPKEEERQIKMSKTFKLSAANIFHATYNKFTKRLTIDPGDSVVLSVDWNLKTDDGTDLFNYFQWKTDTKCLVYYEVSHGVYVVSNRRISDRQNFLVNANIKLFDRLAILHIQNINVSQCFMAGHAGEGKLSVPPCADFIQFDPCSVINH